MLGYKQVEVTNWLFLGLRIFGTLNRIWLFNIAFGEGDEVHPQSGDGIDELCTDVDKLFYVALGIAFSTGIMGDGWLLVGIDTLVHVLINLDVFGEAFWQLLE